MADWRNSSGKGRGKSAKAGARQSGESSPSARDSGWQRGGSRRFQERKKSSFTGTDRSTKVHGAWTTRYPWLAILLGILSMVALASFLLVIFLEGPKLPIVHIKSSVTKEGRIDLAYDPFWDSQRLKESKHLDPHEISLASFRETESRTWIKQIPAEFRSKKGLIAGGGPSRRVTLYVVSTPFVCKGEEIRLVASNSHDKNPFAEKSPESIALKELLETIANATDDRSYAWIAFDIQPSPPVANLADLLFPVSQIERTYNDLKPDLRKKLFVSIPCSKGQNSLLSPLLQSSIFSHFLTKGLATGFRDDQWFTIKNFTASHSLMEFHESLKKQVGDWTWRYLHTTQTVHLLLNDPSSPPAVKVLSTANVNTKRDAAKFKELSVDSSLSPAENLDKLVLARSWRTDPLEQADKESKLVLAEQLRFWKKEKKLLERIEKELEERSPQSSNHQKESFWSIWEPRDESEERKEWCELVKKSESESVIRELRAFADSTPTGQQPSMEWVFAKSLSDAIDWRNPENPFDDPDGSMDDCLKELIQDFNLFQKVAYEYQSEVLHVSARDFSEREREFLSAYDLFVQQNFSECKKSIDDYRKRLDKFGKQAELSENLFRIQKDLLHALPHIVSVCQRLDAMEARSSNRRDDQRQFSEKLFELVQGYGELEMELSSAIAQVTLPALEKKASLEKIGDDLDRLVEEIGKHFDEYGDAKSDEIQRIQIGLTWPFLKTQTRKKFLENLPSLMNNPSGGSVKAPDYEKKEGIDRLPGARISQGLLSSFFTEDPRFNGWCKQDVDNSGQSLRDLYTASVQVRLFALPLAQNLSLSNQTDARSQSAKRGWENWQQWLQWRTAEVRVERLARGMWGYGDLLKDGLQNVYAKRAVQALRNSLKRREKGLDLIEEIDKRLWDSENKLNDNLRLLSQPLILDRPAEDSGSELLISSLDRKDDIRLHGSLHRSQHHSIQVAGKDRRALSLKTDIEQPFELPKDPFDLKLSFRGNTIPSQVAGHPDRFVIVFKPSKAGESYLTVTKKSDPISVAMMIDCSSSMVTHSKDAQRICRNLLDTLARRSEEGQEIHLAILPFATTEMEGWGLGKEVATYKDESSIIRQTYVYGSGLAQLDQVLVNDLKEKIDGIDVRQSGARLTPLYESLSYAKQRLSEYERQLSATSKKMIVVISDGVNFDPESRLKFEDWKDAWLRDAGSPAVFLYQYEGEKSEDKGEQTAVIRKGEQERSTLVNDKFYRNSENLFKTFEELERAVIELFPRVKVNLHPGDAIDAVSDRFVGSKIPVRIGQAERRYQVWLDGGAPSGQLPSGEDCSEKQEAVFAPGEYIQLECKGSKLLPVLFQEDLGLKDGFLGPAIEVDKKYYCKSTEMGGELQLRIGVDRKDFPLEKPRRPKFCCAWIKVGEEGFPYADFSFKAGTHHPLVEFAPVRFPGQLRTLQEKKSSYRVWVAEEWPDSKLPDDVKLPMEKVAQDVEVNLPGAWNLKGTIEKKEGRVTIRVVEDGFRPEVFFFCRSRRTEEFAQAKRMFTKDRTKQEHFFSIPSSEWNDYEVVCLSTEKLKELQEMGVVLGFEVPSDELKN